MRRAVLILLITFLLLKSEPVRVKASVLKEVFYYTPSARLLSSGTGWLLSNDPASFFSNPSVLTLHNYYKFEFTHGQLLGMTFFDALSLNFPFHRKYGTAGVGLVNIYTGGIQKYTPQGDYTGKDFYHFTMINLSWGRRLFHSLHAGAGFSAFREGGFSYGKGGTFLNAGLTWQPTDVFVLGAGVNNFDPLTRTFSVYCGSSLQIFEKLMTNIEIDYNAATKYILLKIGGVFEPIPHIELSAGYMDGINAGVSYQYRKWRFSYAISFRSGGPLHWISISFQGKPWYPRRAKAKFRLPFSRQVVFPRLSFVINEPVVTFLNPPERVAAKYSVPAAEPPPASSLKFRPVRVAKASPPAVSAPAQATGAFPWWLVLAGVLCYSMVFRKMARGRV